MGKTARLLLMLSGVFVAAICGFLLAVPFFGFGWHVLHADYISWAGWKIPVPKDYFVRQDEKGSAIWKLSFGTPYSTHRSVMSAFFSLKSGDKAFVGTSDTAQCLQAVSETATENGYQFKAKHIVSVGTKTASCFEFGRSGKQPRSLVRCATENGNIFPFFEGDAKYVPELFTTLRGMSQESVTANRDVKQ
jgi:hypothetical protein